MGKKMTTLFAFLILTSATVSASAADWSVRSAENGNCPKCEPGEFMVTQYETLPPSGEQIQGSDNPPCAADPAEHIEKISLILRNAGNSYNYNLPAVASGLGGLLGAQDVNQTSTGGNEIVNYLKGQPGFIANSLTGPRKALCKSICVKLNKSAKVSGYSFRISHHTSGEMGACSHVEGKCISSGTSRVLGPPRIIEDEYGVLVCLPVKHWKHNTPRNVEFDVYFNSPTKPAEVLEIRN
jgi:hypothetical protein